MAIGSIIGAIAADRAGKRAQDTAEAQLRAGREALAKVKLPELEKQRIALEELALTGEYDPILEQLIELGPSAMEEIEIDPRLRAAQMRALEQLGEVSESGLTEADMAAIEEARRGAEASSQARQEQILQDMQQRGQGGSGAELAARLAAGQAATDRQGQASLQIAQEANKRALEALLQRGELGSRIRAQEFGEASDVARARDLINRFNVQSAQGLQQRNVGTQNLAQQLNLSERQRIADQNIALRNQQQMYNKELLRQRYLDELNRQKAMYGMAQDQARNTMSAGAREAGLYSQIGAGVDKGLSAAVMAGMGGFGSPKKPDEDNA